MTREELIEELECARLANKDLPYWKRFALEQARLVEVRYGVIEVQP